jgi:hypothetical protein
MRASPNATLSAGPPRRLAAKRRLSKNGMFGIDISDRLVIYRICPDHQTLTFAGD